MLKIIALAVCVLGFAFLTPKALAEFRRALPRSRTRLKGNTEEKQAGDESKPTIAA
ncbi:MAG TPA: hypothetical protein VKB81_00930 [Nitrospira sp.]|nr:hypothetical protein [Nitrospira sp.]